MTLATESEVVTDLANLDYRDEDEEDDDIDSLLLGGNDENKSLDKEIKAKQAHLLDVENQLEENTTRVMAMEDHIKNVAQESAQTKQLCDRRQKEVESQEHQIVLAQRERERLERERKSITAEIQQYNEQLNDRQSEIFKFQQRIDTIKDEMKWGDDKLSKWLEEAQRLEEDTEVLEKYSLADESRVKELQLEIEKETVAKQRDSNLLDSEVTETHTHELGLDKVSQMFRQVHQERTSLINRWEKTLNQMQERDSNIQEVAENFQRLKVETAKFERLLKEQEAMLEEEKLANEETEKKTVFRERDLDQVQQQKNRLVEELHRFESELASLRSTLSKTTTDERSKAAEARQLRDTARAWKAKVANMVTAIQDRQDDVDGINHKSLTAEEQAKQLDDALEREVEHETDLHGKLERAQSLAAKESQRLYELKQQSATVSAEIAATTAMVNNLVSKVRALDKRQLDEEQLLYRQDFEIASLERKLSKMQGKVNDDKTKEMEVEIVILRETLSGHTQSQTLLKQQLQKLDDELRLCNKRTKKDTAEYESLKDKLAELELEITRSQEDLTKTKNAKEDLMVNENILKLELRRMRMQLNTRADKVFTLEQQQLQLKVAMDERMDEIKIHKDLLHAQLKAANAQRSQVTTELKQRESRVEQLKKRHEIIVFSTAPPTEDGEVKSQAYLLVQAAQEREELQNLGDDLDTKIRKGEKEIRQLENVLHKMNGKNNKFRQSLRKVGENDSDASKKEQLEAQHRTVMDRFRHSRRERNKLQAKAEQLRTISSHAESEVESRYNDINETSAAIANLDSELASQQAKFDRAESTAKQIVKMHRKDAGDPTSETEAELDFKLKHMKDFNRSILSSLDALVQQHPEIGTELSMLYEQAGIDAKAMLPRRMGGSSVTSSRASVSSRGSSRRTQPSTAAQAAARRNIATPKTVQIGLGL